VFVRDALVLAAGNGDRFHNGTHQSKLLQPILGVPLIVRILERASEAGILAVEIVLGYQAEHVRTAVEAGVPAGMRVHFSYNPDWHLENGVSVLTARPCLADRRFALLMGDHVFEPGVLARLLRLRVAADESLLAVDSRPATAEVAAEATKVRREADRIVAIGKDLLDYDALDTGMFVCAPAVFAALDESRASGDTTLSGGIRELARRRLMRGVDIGEAAWYDIDTLADLRQAERRLMESATHDLQAEPV
jgi:choline kinase